MILLLDYLATFIFGVVGAFRAIKYELDLFGVIFISIITSTLGGIIRDIILDVKINSFIHCEYLMIAIISGILTFYFNRWLVKYWFAITALDSIGLVLFSLIGSFKAYSLGYNSTYVIVSGFITACGGGLIKDILINRIPDLFIEDIYGSLSILTSAVFILNLNYLALEVNIILTFILMILIRGIVLKYKLNLPKVKKLKYKPSEYRQW